MAPHFRSRRPIRNLPQINERIRFPEIRVVDSDGTQLGIITPQEAMEIANEVKNALVLAYRLAVGPGK